MNHAPRKQHEMGGQNDECPPVANGRGDEQRNGNPKWPTQPGRVFLNLWANNSGLSWVGPFTYHGPYHAVFTDVSVP